MRWRGRWVLGVASLHTLFALVEFRQPLVQLLTRGLFDAVGDDAMLGAVTWFVLFGFVLAALGLAVDDAERHGRPGRGVGLWLALVTVLGVVLMPVSGLWLLLPPALSLIRSGPKALEHPRPSQVDHAPL